MSYAILSDIHANHEALLHCLDDLGSYSVDRILCLGDIIGYGPDPCKTLDLARQTFDFSLKGNHEHAVLFEPSDAFNEEATAAIHWTQDQIREADREREEDSMLWSYLTSLREWRQEEDRLYVHATPNEPLNEYLSPEDIDDDEKLEPIFDRITSVSFGGHTHKPGVFEIDEPRFLKPEDIDHVYTLNERKAHINVGSVGQSRDGNNDACYVIVNEDEVHFQRVNYAVEDTAEKIFDNEHLPDSIGNRLLDGQ